MFGVILLMLGVTEKMCAEITYAEGNMNLIINGGNDPICTGGMKITKTQQFPGTFNNIPQLMIFLTKYEIEVPDNGFILEHTQTKTSFDASITCQHGSKKVQSFSFKWVAVDDNRIRVLDISQDNRNSAETGLGTYTYPHDLINAKQLFTTITHFSFNDIKFLISFLGEPLVTSCDVTLGTKFSDKLPFLGFQLIIGTEDAFILDSNILKLSSELDHSRTLTKSLEQQYVYFAIQVLRPFITDESDKFFYFEIENVQTDTDISFGLSQNTWSQGLFQIYFQVVGYSQISYMVDYPLLCSKMRIAKKKQTFEFNYQVQLQVNGDPTTAQIINTVYQETVNKSPGEYNIIDLIVSFKCTPGKSIVGQVLKCIDCIQQNYDLSTDCYGGIDFVEYHIRLFQKDQVYQQVTIDIIESKVQILQLVKGPQNSTVLSIELQ